MRKIAVALFLCSCANGQLHQGFAEEGDAGTEAGVLAFGHAAAPTVVKDAASDACPENATLVYVIDDANTLYSFYPPKQTFTKIGKLECLTMPTHMTVDRTGVAWIVAGGRMYEASTTDASCSQVATWKADAEYYDFSLTFIGTTNALDRTLYLMNDAVTLVTFDIVTGVRTPIAPAIQISSTQGDMTSDADGKLWFLRKDPDAPTLYELDPKNAAVLTQDTLGATGGSTQALAFWGGAFYAFENDVIYAYDPMKKTTAKLGLAPITVIGAGQSTCVPRVPPIK